MSAGDIAIIIGALFLGLVQLWGMWLNYLREGRHNTRLNNIASTTNLTHDLVNNNMRIQLALNATVTRRLADMTKGTPDGPVDEKVAAEAFRVLREHDVKQAKADAAVNKVNKERDVLG